MRRRYIILSFFMVGVLPGFATFNQEYVDSLYDLLQNTEVDTTHIIALKELAYELRNVDQDSAIHCAEQALALSEKLNWEIGIGKSMHVLAIYAFMKGNHSLALEYNKRALEINTKFNDMKGMAEDLGNMGVIYRNQGNYPKALECYFKAIKLNEELDNTDNKNRAGISRNLGNIGLVYWNQGELEEALKYFFKALKMDEEQGRKRGIASNIGNIGLIYSEQGEDIKALEYYLRALKIDEELGYTRGVIAHLGNIGLVYDKMGNHDKALEYYTNTLKICNEIGDKQSAGINLCNIGSVRIQQGRFTEGEESLLAALESAKEMNALNLMRQVERLLSTLYEKSGQYKKAFDHYTAFTVVKDSLFNEEKSKDLGKLEAKHEFEAVETERRRAEAEAQKAAEAQESRRNNLQYSGILIFIVLVFALVFALGRISIPIRLAEGLIFFSFLLFFEFTLVLLDPFIEEYSSGAPAIKLGFNALLAALIFPLHSLFETKLKKRLVK